MLLSVSAVLLFGIATLLLLRYRALTVGSAIVPALFGFYLASTGIAPTVNHTLTNLAHTLASLH